MYATEENSAPMGSALSGPGTELDRVLGERERIRAEQKRLTEKAEELDKHARKLYDALAGQMHSQDEPKSY